MHSDAANYPDLARTDRAWPILILILVGAFSFDLGQGSARADGSSTPQEQQALAVRVRAIFREKCTQCHDPKLRRPIGKFTDVLDLARLAEDPHLVVPFQAEASNLWKLVQKDKMPPAGAKAGPLTSEEKAVVHAWIASGAPVDSSTATGHTALSAPASPNISVAKHILGWLGKFHILIVHFPIALLLAAAFGETLRLCWSNRGLEAAVRFCVVLAALSSVPAVALGWLHADIGGHGAGSMEILRLHRWLGTAACLWAMALAVLLEWDTRRQRRRLLFRVALGIGALLVSATGHFGGTLVHGAGFFDW